MLQPESHARLKSHLVEIHDSPVGPGFCGFLRHTLDNPLHVRSEQNKTDLLRSEVEIILRPPRTVPRHLSKAENESDDLLIACYVMLKNTSGRVNLPQSEKTQKKQDS